MPTIYLVFLFVTRLMADEDKGIKYFQNGDYEKALKYYESVLQKEIDNKEAKFGLGTVTFQTEDIQSAEEAFKQTLSSEDIQLQSKAHYNLGNLYYHKQELDQSLAHFKKSIELNPSDPDAKWNYELVQNIKKQQQNQKNESEDDSKNKEEKEQKNQSEQQQDKQQQDKQQQNNKESKENQEQEPSESDKKEEEQKKEEKDNKSQKENEKNQNEEENQSQSSQGQEEKSLADTSKTKMNAQAILNALKDKEKINKRRQIKTMKSRKMEKDW